MPPLRFATPLLLCVVDNQMLAGTTCGHAKGSHRQQLLLRRTYDTILHLVLISQARPKSDISDPIQWRKRDLNQEADGLCNWAMDFKRDEVGVRPDLGNILPILDQFMLWTDGGRRDSGEGGMGVVLRGRSSRGGAPFRPLVYCAFYVLFG